VATELTRRRLRLSAAELTLPAVPLRALVIPAFACAVLVYASVAAAMFDAQRDEDTARRRYEDALALLAVPPGDAAALERQLELTQLALVVAEARAAAPALDPQSDATTELIVRTARSAGVDVAAITRLAPSQFKTEANAYAVEAVRIGARGSTDALVALLEDLDREAPWLVATLTSMSLGDAGEVQAELVFSTYTKVSAEAAP
jgi:hypothetical protein